LGTWQGGREKSPAAICRKVIKATHQIEVWGDGKQTRSFLYIDDCIDAVRLLVNSNFRGPVNIGSEEMVTINELVNTVKSIAGKNDLKVVHVEGPQGVRGRNSDNELIEAKLDWHPNVCLYDGLKRTYKWIEEQVNG